MNANFRPWTRRIIRCACVVALLAVAMNGELLSQFQMVTGGFGHEASRGVIQTGDGNFVTVGYTTSFTPTQDVYLVKTDTCGDVVWAREYDLGGHEIGWKVREVTGGNLVIVGSTTNDNNCCTRDDAFLMSVSSDGRTINWAKTYGAADRDEAYDVVVTTDNLNRLTYIVAGRSNSFGAGDFDGWLFRTDDVGNLIWGKVYGAEGSDGFSSLDIDCQRNVIAAGNSTSYSRAGDEDIFVVWADSTDGAALHANIYGGAGNEGAHGVTNTRGGNFYVVGYTTTVGLGTEAYVMKGECGTGRVIADRAFGGLDTIGDDQFTELRVIRATGNLILSGYLQHAPRGLGDYDMQLTELDTNLGHVFTKVYGGPIYEWGWSVAVVSSNRRAYDLITAGGAYSFAFGRIDQYEVLALSNGTSGCNEADPHIQRETPGFIANEVRFLTSHARVQCTVHVGLDTVTQDTVLCSECDRYPDVDNDDQGDLSGNVPIGRDAKMQSRPVAVRVAERNMR